MVIHANIIANFADFVLRLFLANGMVFPKFTGNFGKDESMRIFYSSMVKITPKSLDCRLLLNGVKRIRTYKKVSSFFLFT